MPNALIAIGSNLGDRKGLLSRAESRLAQLPASRVLAQSRRRETAPAGGPPGQGPFLNAAVLLQTSLEPAVLLESLQVIEADLGRRRAERWGPRPIDLDLLLYDQLVLETPTLTLPHPRMAWRRFVLEPAAEIASALVHPTIGWTIGRLLEHLNTSLSYVAITGLAGAGKTWLAQQLAQHAGVALIAHPAGSTEREAYHADRSGSDWPVEVEFLEERTRLLAADLPQWSEPGRSWVSDFWLDQSMAHARAWLAGDEVEAFRRRWQVARQGVVQPKLIVLLDPPVDSLLKRIRQRGRPDEVPLGPEVLERLGREIRNEAKQPDRGPLLRLSGEDRREILDEVLAALDAMR